MEDWEFDYEWLRVRHIVKKSFNKETLPDLNSILFLIGVQELGRWEGQFTKEQKQDLMHIAVCRLLSYDGHYNFVGRDADGWPHYELAILPKIEGLAEQDKLLKIKAIQYFKELNTENGGFDEEE